MEASPNTIAGYRDTFRLLLRFATEQTGQAPTQLRIEDLDATLVADFLTQLETTREQQRPQPQHAAGRNPILLPFRGDERTGPSAPLPAHPRHARANAMCAARWTSWTGRRWRRWSPPRTAPRGWAAGTTLSCIVALQTGLRASELINLRRSDIVTGTGAHIRCEGKGRKQRAHRCDGKPSKFLRPGSRSEAVETRSAFPDQRGDQLSRDALEHLVRQHTLAASTVCPSLDRQTGQPACPPAQHGHGPAASWRRSIRDRALARA